MKNAFNRILPFFFITGFILYWISIFILAMPPNVVKGFITDRAPRYNSLFGNSWNFFAPPYTYYNRLYYIIREKTHPNKVDTIEVIENISKQKQHNAPFNQKQNIIDHLINHDVGMIIYIVWNNKKRPSDSEPGTTDSTYIANAIAAVAENSNYLNSKATLFSYGNVVLKENKIDTAGKEIKIVITQTKINPFKNMSDTTSLQKEIIFIKTSFNPIKR